jgi:hypothetical protein
MLKIVISQRLPANVRVALSVDDDGNVVLLVYTV